MKGLGVIRLIILLFPYILFGQRDLVTTKADNNFKPLPSTIYYCPGTSRTIRIVPSSTGVSTDHYDITEINGIPHVPPLEVSFSYQGVANTFRNAFSDAIDLPFDFTLYGKTYRKVVVGSNGRLVFTNAEINQIPLIDQLQDSGGSGATGRTYRDNYPENFEKQIPRIISYPEGLEMASIFAGWTRLQSGVSTNDRFARDIFYQSDSQKFIVEFRKIEFDGGVGEVLSSQVILYPDGHFDIILMEKGLPSDSALRRAIIGVQDETGSNGQWPTNTNPNFAADSYNNGEWEIKNTESKTFSFTPGKLNLIPVHHWKRLRDGTETNIGVGEFYTVNTDELMPEDRIYAITDYFDDNGNFISSNQSQVIRFIPFPSGYQPPKPLICGNVTRFDLGFFINDFRNFLSENFQFNFFKPDNSEISEGYVNPIDTPNLKMKVSGDNLWCPAEYDIEFQVLPPIDTPLSPDEIENFYPRHCESRTESFDLSELKNALQVGDLRVEFYRDASLTDRVSQEQIRMNGRVYVKVFRDGFPDCFESYPVNLIVYNKPQFSLPQQINKTSVTCGLDEYDLTVNPNDYIAWSGPLRMAYFDGNGAKLQSEEVLNYNPNRGIPFVRFVYNETNPDCTECSDDIPFNLIKLEVPEPLKTSPFYLCDEESYALSAVRNELYQGDFDLLDLDGNVISADFDLNGDLVYPIVIRNNLSGCESEPFDLIFQKAQPTPVINPDEIVACDAEGDPFDGKTTVDLTQREAQMHSKATFTYYDQDGTLIQNPAQYTTSGPLDKVQVKVQARAEGFCPTFTEIDITVDLPVKVQGLQPEYDLCYGKGLILSLQNPEDYSTIEWRDPEGNLVSDLDEVLMLYKDVKFGLWSVTLTAHNGCSYTETFVVSKNKQPRIVKANTDNNRIEVFAEGGEPPYEYSFDGHTWSNSPILENPDQPYYKILVRNELTDCEGEPFELYFVSATNVITPNGDGKNDYWEPLNLSQMQEVELIISDRYGNTMFRSTQPDRLRWDGTMNGRPLPTASYWYVMKWTDPSTGESHVRDGWILLKNRN